MFGNERHSSTTEGIDASAVITRIAVSSQYGAPHTSQASITCVRLLAARKTPEQTISS